MNRISILVTTMILAGCSAAYQAQEITDKYSDPDKPRMIAMRGNAIDFNDPLGGIEVSELNGFVERDRTTNRVVGAGFRLKFVGDNGWIGIRQGDEMVFLCSGERIALRAASTRADKKVNNMGSFGLSVDYIDSATYPATIEQFGKIANGQCSGFKVYGANYSSEFPRRNYKILESFQQNIARFYVLEIEPTGKQP